ncbi:OPT family small oligopeptide transporter [Spizellomyces punctatus DAOM BR117]|uniref:OPT family small oligopeptide transporter n=1 Tax=Spizellomyces punctatus (strain DAOM BR117) TaxID=645134 RepID=A0A0L0HQU2_SPIPD|nr:OPT family small oligopeptide transporter [Spizellomyces punctatus DAOM BR117]KND03315.1 OPT family small oligopeptide transporter [Spizellomyces punctatus DAOM BR117]|eukprot:XP_016611354.1 OPT family small oligopeptide transporter [Spizellomyces punctatus DAOM BR117]
MSNAQDVKVGHTVENLQDPIGAFDDIKKDVEAEVHTEKEGESQAVDELVAAAVEETDDPATPVITFRFISMSIFWAVAVSGINQYMWFRALPIQLQTVAVQLLSFFMGKFLERALPTTKYHLPLIGEWTMNPGPFNKKEHCLINVFANAGFQSAYAVDIVVIQRAWYKQNWGAAYGILLVLTTQMFGYGIAGICRNILVYPPSMIWPTNLVSTTVRAFDIYGGRQRFFGLVFAGAFIWYWFPGYIMPIISSLSIMCWFAQTNPIVGNLGSGSLGMGIGNFTLNWSQVIAYLTSPLAYPTFAIANILVGALAIFWVITPWMYYTNFWDSKLFPILSSGNYAVLKNETTGEIYDIDRILTPEKTLNMTAYNEYSPLRLSTVFAFTYGVSFAALTCIFTHVLLYNGKDIWQRFRKSRTEDGDIHNKMMKAYPEAPLWWYFSLWLVTLAVSIFVAEYWETHLPWWGVMLAAAMAIITTIPIGIVTATTNNMPGTNVITELVIGYLLPGKPIANILFKTYGYIGQYQAITFLQDLKLGHYMKVPPRAMFIAQTAGTLVCGIIQYLVMDSIMTNAIKDDPANMSPNSQYPTPNAHVFYSASVIWGVIGPNLMFGPESLYSAMYWFFLIGFLLPIPAWLLHKKYPNFGWDNVHWPAILNGTLLIPPAAPVNYITWGIVGITFNHYIRKNRSRWWKKYNYVLSAALDCGTIVATLVIASLLQNGSYKADMPEYFGNRPFLDPATGDTQEYCRIDHGDLL